MPQFLINENLSFEREVEASYFETNGDFVDFIDSEGRDSTIVFRVKAATVQTIEMKPSL